MGRNKYKLPDDLKMKCISLVRGYERRKKLYHDLRDEVFHGQKFKGIEYKLNQESCVEFLPVTNKISDTSYSKTERLLMIEDLIAIKEMKAVEQAINQILVESDSDRVVEAIIFSCKNGRRFYFGYWNLPICRDTFYSYRRKFLYYVAKNIENF